MLDTLKSLFDIFCIQSAIAYNYDPNKILSMLYNRESYRHFSYSCTVLFLTYSMLTLATVQEMIVNELIRSFVHILHGKMVGSHLYDVLQICLPADSYN